MTRPLLLVLHQTADQNIVPPRDLERTFDVVFKLK